MSYFTETSIFLRYAFYRDIQPARYINIIV